MEAGYVLSKVRTIVEIPLDSASKVWQAIQQAWLERLHGENRHQANHGADAHHLTFAIGDAQNVVVKTVFLMPDSLAVNGAVHGLNNEQEVLPELYGCVFVNRVFDGEVEGHHEQVE